MCPGIWRTTICVQEDRNLCFSKIFRSLARSVILSELISNNETMTPTYSVSSVSAADDYLYVREILLDSDYLLSEMLSIR